jgi:hypothetical protein
MGAPLNPVPNVLKVVLQGFVDSSSTEVWANVLHFQYSGTAPTNTVCAGLGGLISNQWATHVASLCPSPTSLQVVSVTDLTSLTAGEGEALVLDAGTRGDDSIPANAAVLISYPSALRYKGGHPRTYLLALGNADLSGAWHWSSAATAEVQAHWQAFLTACIGITDAGTTLSGFCSIRYRGKFLPNSGPPHYYLTTPLINPIAPATATAQAEIASQRGRVGRRRK